MQQQGGSPYGAPPPSDMSLFSSPPSSSAAPQQHQQMVGAAAESATPQPISSRPPPLQHSSAAPNYEDLGGGEDPLGPLGEEGTGGGGMSGGGNRWPRQETLALLKIRSDMDATFRDATLKGPLWDEVSRKLAELGYRRSAKKCKEKFENVHKYYKRTKEGRAGRQDGKSYRFFSQLEALHNTTAAAAATSVFPTSTVSSSVAMMGTNAAPAPVHGVTTQAAGRFQTTQQISAPTPIATAPPPQLQQLSMSIPMLAHENPNIGAAVAAAGISFASNTSSDASESDGEEEDDDDDEATQEGPSSGKKRKREGSGGGGRKMMAFFEGLMRQVMERQEAMQQRFLEAIEKREQDRMIREEAWRRQEMARIAREHELAAGERAAAAARDAAVIAYLQKVTGQTVQIPPQTTTTAAAAASPSSAPAPPPATVSLTHTPPQSQIQQQLTLQSSQRQQLPPPMAQQQTPELVRQQYHQQQQQPQVHLTPPPVRPTSTELVPIQSASPQEGGATVSVSMDPASSRWPKSEVHALIKLRSGLDSRYQESGPKGPLWEEISAGMQRLGYNRSSKRCKEKWENINKYFKKVKESNKKRPEDAKTCPYFHQLDALYRSKQLHGSSGVPALTQGPQEHETHINPNPNPISVMPPPPQPQQPMNQPEVDIKKGNGGATEAGVRGPNNGGLPTSFFSNNSGDNSGILKKPEDIVKELMGDSNSDYGRVDEPDSDNMDEDDDDEDDEDGGKSQYTIQFQRQNVGGGNGGGTPASAAPSSGGKSATGSFLAMVR